MSLKHTPTQSFADSSFFTKLSQLKLDVLKLDQSQKQVYGFYNFKNLGKEQIPSITLNDNSFYDLDIYLSKLSAGYNFTSPGSLYNVNTFEEFKTTNKLEFLKSSGEAIYNKIKDKSVLTNPSLLSEFSVLSFADLKKYKFYYWFAFPVLHADWEVKSITTGIQLNTEQIENLTDQIAIIDTSSGELVPFSKLLDYDPKDQLHVLFIDTSSQPNSSSYVLKNLLTTLAIYNYNKVTTQIYRFNSTSSYTLTTYTPTPAAIPKISGWERTSQGKLGPKLADLGSLIDPVQLADQAIDLNLKLMKWRIVPDLDLDVVRNTKCLLLGSGTLGSYVGRALLAWGVRKITFVDNGKVSFSNPVRQPLYKFEDCLEGGEEKAKAAAKALKEVFPLVDAQGISLEVPMAGHPLTNENKQKEDYNKLVSLIEEHDAIFLLMDSRETRWLPTVIGNVKHKIVINAALGFGSYLVMRHGCVKPDVNLTSEDDDQTRLGCYFCNDVYAPSDSTTDRTLDQMCTVTRPGVALMASSFAVELMVSVLQHKDKQYAPHELESITTLGSLPHQIRGFLHNFETLKLKAQNYKYCAGCSNKVLNEFNVDGWEFVKKALNDSKYIEELTGLTKVHKEAEEAELILDIDDSDDELV